MARVSVVLAPMGMVGSRAVRILRNRLGKNVMHKLFRMLATGPLLGAAIGTLALGQGCSQGAEAKVQVEKLPDVVPNLPQVPTLPPPPHPLQYADQSHSIYGVRKRVRHTIDTSVSVTGYIVKIFEPPACAKGQRCPTPPAPHFWLADTAAESDAGNMLLVAGYAENHQAIADAVKAAKRGKPRKAPPAETGLVPVPTDLAVGNKVTVQGRFTYMSGSGFHSSDGVLTYEGHETLQ